MTWTWEYCVQQLVMLLLWVCLLIAFYKEFRTWKRLFQSDKAASEAKRKTRASYNAASVLIKNRFYEDNSAFLASD